MQSISNDTTATANSAASRLPRWTRDESLILMEAKRAYESERNTSCPGHPSESKWTYVSSYCRERGVERGPLQCRKRWSNLACEYRKIKAWQADMARSGRDESYWSMRSNARREKKLPGFFDREAFEMMMAADRDDDQVVDVEVREEVVFGRGRMGRDDGLFSEYEAEEAEEEMTASTKAMTAEPLVVVPISERKYLPENEHYSDPGNSSDKHQADNNKANNHEKAYSPWEGKKRQRTNKAEAEAEAEAEENSLESKLIEVLENYSRILSAQFEAYTINSQLDREERKDQTDGLIAIMTGIADALGKIADKL